MNSEFEIEIEEQECDDVAYDFTGIPMVVTSNLMHELRQIDGATPEEIIFLAHMSLLEKYEGRNMDYLQIFHLKKAGKEVATFWCISNKERDEPINEKMKNEYNMCFLRPDDY